MEALIPDGLDVKEGDVVLIELAPRHVLRAAVIVYGLPLAGAAIGAAVAYTAGLGDAGAAALAILGLLTGLYAGRRRLERQTCLAEFTPVVAGYPGATTQQH